MTSEKKDTSKSKSYTKILIALFVLLAIGSGWYNYNYFFVKPASDIKKITINQAAKTLLYLPLYVAIDKEYFGDSLQVTVNTGGGDSQAFSALLSGNAQFAQGDPAFVAISHEKGVKARVIASVLNRASFWGVSLNPKDEVISNPQGFINKTVVTYPCPNTACLIQKELIKRANLKLDKNTKMIAATFGAEFGPVQTGAANMAVSIEPAVSQAVQNGGKVVFSYADLWGPFLLTGLMSTENYIRDNQKVVQTVVEAYEKSLRYIHSNPEGAIEVGKRQFPEVPTEVIRMAVLRMIKEGVFPAHAFVETDAWHNVLQLRVDMKDLQAMPAEDLRDNSFAEQALGK